MSSPLWTIVQDWFDKQQVKPSWAKVAEAMGVSQSTFDTWKNPAEMPRRRNLWAIHELTRVPFKTVVDAAIESAEMYNAERARVAQEAHRLKKERSGDVASAAEKSELEERRERKAQEVSDTPEIVDPAALDTEEGVDEEPGGSDHD